MGLFSRRRSKDKADPVPSRSEARKATLEHFRVFASTRRGVEAYIEPPTNVTQTTLMLIAVDGEWTRRRVPDADTARHLARELAIPVYDVNLVGYPQRMREWNTARRRSGHTAAGGSGPARETGAVQDAPGPETIQDAPDRGPETA